LLGTSSLRHAGCHRRRHADHSLQRASHHNRPALSQSAPTAVLTIHEPSSVLERCSERAMAGSLRGTIESPAPQASLVFQRTPADPPRQCPHEPRRGPLACGRAARRLPKDLKSRARRAVHGVNRGVMTLIVHATPARCMPCHVPERRLQARSPRARTRYMGHDPCRALGTRQAKQGPHEPSGLVGCMHGAGSAVTPLRPCFFGSRVRSWFRTGLPFNGANIA
jgi:hypothetical protein